MQSPTLGEYQSVWFWNNRYISSYIYAPDSTAPPALDATRNSDVYLSFIQP